MTLGVKRYREFGEWPWSQDDLEPGDYVRGHPLIGQATPDGRVVVAVRTPESERNGTEHVWVLTVAEFGDRPHPFDWTYWRHDWAIIDPDDRCGCGTECQGSTVCLLQGECKTFSAGRPARMAFAAARRARAAELDRPVFDVPLAR